MDDRTAMIDRVAFMSWHLLPEIDWQKVVLDPVFLYLTAWFVSGFLLTWIPTRWRIASFTVVGVLLQGILRGTTLPAFELMNILVYLYAVIVQFKTDRTPHADSSDLDIRGPAAEPAAWRWTLACWGMLALVMLAFALRDFVSEQQASVEIGQVRWVLLVLDFFQLLRLVTFLHEYGSGVEELPSFKNYFLWANLPPMAFIIRLSELLPQLDGTSVSPRWHEILHWRQLIPLAAGALKWIAGAILGSITVTAFSPEYAWAYKVAAVFFLGPWSFYLVSAGMVDVQRFIARTWNLDMPMAWNAPFFRSNLSTFWANWNMTMTSIYRDYFFFNRWGLPQPNLYLNAMIVFVAMGVWHALNWYWLLFGVYHGIGFCAYLGFQQLKKKYGFAKAMSAWPIVFICWLITYVFVCLGWLVPSKIVLFLGLAGGMNHDG